MENLFEFDMPENPKSVIKVIGVGGGGGNAVNYMYQKGIKDVEFFVCNTDVQDLRKSPIGNKIQIGASLTMGKGAGSKPEVGMRSAIESKEHLREILADTQMLFITAGMGGGTGTGASPILAKIAKDLDILTVGIVTMPFNHEGDSKMILAEKGLAELKENCDTVLVILNEKIFEIYGNLKLKDAYNKANEILSTSAKGIAEIITVSGIMNIDFADVETAMKGAGTAVMGTAIAQGESRALRAVELALNSPLLNNTSIKGAKNILVSVSIKDENDLELKEIQDINNYLQEMASSGAFLKCGVFTDESLEDKMRVTVMATGFINQTPTKPTTKVIDLASEKTISEFKTNTFELDPNTHHLRNPGLEFNPSPSALKNSPEPETKEYRMIDKVNMPNPEEEDLISRTQKFAKELENRKKSLLGLGQSISMMPSDQFNDRLKVPAYVRAGIKLQDLPHSSERIISRFNLNDENEMLGNNKFLHDNVD